MHKVLLFIHSTSIIPELTTLVFYDNPPEKHLMPDNGLIIVFTGEGKGKTTAALGVALRAVGHRMYVSVVQFLKSSLATGEAKAAERLAPELEFVSLGRGFVNCCGSTTPLAEHRKAAGEALRLARQRMLSGAWDVLVLDELNTAVALGLVDITDVLDMIRNKPPKLHLIVTGRNARPELVAIADMVTEMRSIKHPYDSGLPARKGIDF
jgi:cob(I)alamin adenosyltransferase